MAYEIVMPQLSDSMEEGKLISWKVKPGDHVKVGDVIAEVESDKAIMEVQSFKEGTVKELKVQEGQSVPVGTVIAVIEPTGSITSEKLGVRSEERAKPAASNEELGTRNEEPKEKPGAPNEELGTRNEEPKAKPAASSAQSAVGSRQSEERAKPAASNEEPKEKPGAPNEELGTRNEEPKAKPAASSAQSAVGSRQSEERAKPVASNEEPKAKTGALNEELGTRNEEPKEKSVKSKKSNDKEAQRAIQTTNDETSILDQILGLNETSPSIQHPTSKIQNPGEATGVASPKARALAAKYGLDIEALQEESKLPTPAHEADVKRYYYRRYFTPKALKLLHEYGLSPELFPVGKKHSEKEILAYIAEHEIPKPEPLSPMRKAIIATVTQAQQKPVYHIYDAIDATLLKTHESERYTLTVWLLKLFSEAMMRHEDFRKTLSGDAFQLWPNASIALAMADGEALYMPVFRDLNRKSVAQIADELAAMKEKVKAGRVTPGDLKGSTFAISNLGMTGIERFDAMINARDCGIAAIGSEIEGKISVTLTLDHRIVNGWQGAQFMQTLKELAKEKTLFKT